MIDSVLEMLSYPFMVKALIAGPLIALCLSLLGVGMVLKRYSMIGDGLSHVSFGALAVASALHMQPLVVGIPVVMISAVLLLRVSEKSKVSGDSAIALISTAALAIGVTAVSATKGMNVDVWNYLFGSILSLKNSDVWITAALAILTVSIFVMYYARIFACTFDENFVSAIGIKVKRYNLMMAIITSLVIIIGMRMVGSLLISSLIVFPSVSAMRVAKSFKKVVIFSALIAVFCTLAGIVVSYYANTPTGASIVLGNLIVLILLSLFRR
ncbi:MAG: metal ABC transporter permease [Bacillota bacterium]|nr:metal ABC transporter permease [Bacillota bacterium]